MGDVGDDHLQPVAILELRRLRVRELTERADALGLQQARHPRLEEAALEDPELQQHAERVADERQLVLPGLVLEAAERDLEQDLVELRGLVARGHERRRDRPGRGARDALGLDAALAQRAVGAGEPDPLHAATLEDQVSERLAHTADPNRSSWPSST